MDTRSNRFAEVVPTSTHNLCFEYKFEKKYQSFLSENFLFLEVKFSIYLNRRVFIMVQQKTNIMELFVMEQHSYKTVTIV